MAEHKLNELDLDNLDPYDIGDLEILEKHIQAWLVNIKKLIREAKKIGKTEIVDKFEKLHHDQQKQLQQVRSRIRAEDEDN